MIPRCQVVPLPDSVFSFEVNGRVLLQWNAAERFRRPFFFPVYGPGQALMTRMGHPGAPDHDHHTSIWFGHYKVLGIDFWSISSTAQIRQLGWQVTRPTLNHRSPGMFAKMVGWEPAPALPNH